MAAPPLRRPSHEPDHAVDFAAWSRHVATDVFLVSHIVGSIFGAALGLVGVACALVLLVLGPAVRTALVAAAHDHGNVLFQPATGLLAAAAAAVIALRLPLAVR